MNSYILYLANEAVNWENTTPVGCGRLGASMWGGVNEECLQLNEEKLWAGGPIELHAEGFAEKLEQVRALLREGKASVQVLPTSDHWYGMTFREDIPIVKDALANL
jgi:alpha-L-fucosidase 2